MWKAIDPKAIQENVFSAIGERWMLLSVGMDGHCNPMTASWGGLGVLWGKNVATVYIRPQRYTYEFMEKTDAFAINFLPREKHGVLELCGTKSGRDIDKVAECGLTVRKAENGAPYFEEAELVLVCKKLYWQDLDPAHFLDAQIDSHYANHDYHRMYIAEIVEALQK